MSGGSLDYVYQRVNDTAQFIIDNSKTQLQREFGEHLLRVGEYLHDIEWVWSGDYGEGDEEKSIKKLLNK